jgi:hypothetical protein
MVIYVDKKEFLLEGQHNVLNDLTFEEEIVV